MKKAQRLLPHLIKHLLFWHEIEFSVSRLADELLRTIDDPDFDALEVCEALIRETIKLLPEGCVKRLSNRRLIIQSRSFAKPEELVEALRQIERERYPETLGMRIPMNMTTIMPLLQSKLVIGREWSIWQSIQWATPREFPYTMSSSFYGMMLQEKVA